MKLSLSETKLMKDSVAVISDLVTEARFSITKDSVELIAMDPANVAMVIFKLFSSAFVEYELKEDVSIAINLNDLKQVFRRIKPSDTMIIELSDGKLKLTLKGNQKRTFNLPLIDVEEKEQKIPNLEFQATVNTSASILSDAIEDVDIVGESVSFRVKKDVLQIMSSSELTKADVEISNDNETKIEAKAEIKAKYSIEYLKKMIQGSKLASSVIVQLNNDYPLRLDYKVIDKLQLSFILAPRVDND